MVKTVSPETPVEDAIVILAEQGLHYLPVVSGDKKLAGIISQSDVMVGMLADRAKE